MINLTSACFDNGIINLLFLFVYVYYIHNYVLREYFLRQIVLGWRCVLGNLYIRDILLQKNVFYIIIKILIIVNRRHSVLYLKVLILDWRYWRFRFVTSKFHRFYPRYDIMKNFLVNTIPRIYIILRYAHSTNNNF